MLTFNPVAPNASPDLKTALHSLRNLTLARSDGEIMAHANNLTSSLAVADEEASFVASPELSCRPQSPREHRRPVISETRTMASEVTLTAGQGIVNQILTNLFSASNSERFFYADGSYKASVEKRQLAGLAAEWDVVIYNRYNRHTGGTASAVVAAAIDEMRVWTEAELEPLKKILNRCGVQIFGTATADPGMDTTQLSYFGAEGKSIPKGLMGHTYFKEKEARLIVSVPSSYPDIIIPVAIDGRVPQVTVKASLTLHGLFVDPESVPRTLRLNK